MGFVPDRLNDQAEVLFVAQNPGKYEEHGLRWTGTEYVDHRHEPLIGKTGYANDGLLAVAGLTREDVSLMNVIRCRHGDSDNLPPLDNGTLQQAMAICRSNYTRIPSKTKLIVASGEYALYAMTQHGKEKNDKITDWRGYVLPYAPIGTPMRFENNIWVPSSSEPLPVLAVYHTAYTLYDPTGTLISKKDFSKISRILSRKWPLRLPVIKEGPPSRWPLQAAFDTEFVPYTDHFICYSLYDGLTLRMSDRLESGVISNDDQPWIVMHNAVADLTFLDRLMIGVPYTYDDTMHAHAVLWSDFAHDLGFLGSIYTGINKWKHLMTVNPTVYSASDAYATWDVWTEIMNEFKRDPQSWDVYRNIQLKLVPIIQQAEAAGIKTNQEKAVEHLRKRQEIIDRLDAIAQSIVGWPINLRSNAQVAKELFVIEGLLKLLK